MINRLLAIQLSFIVILSSVGFRVMHHHCIWCGGDRVELLASSNSHCTNGSCCSTGESADQHKSHHQDCCQEELIKIKNALVTNGSLIFKKSSEKEPVADFFLVQAFQVLAETCLPAGNSLPPPIPRHLSRHFHQLNILRC